MRAHFLIGAILTAAIAMWSCGGGGSGGGYSNSSPSTPSPTPAPAAPNSVTINIVGTSGSTAFSPNPVQATTGATLVWKNNTSSTHRLVMDDGSAVVGEIAPGASSTPMPLRGSGGNYHCTNHPSMVGSINGATPPPSDTAPPGDGYRYGVRP